ncbi:MAG: phosphoribosylglycinamide formyltransferase [Candidatus Thermoplasmatota archaeon]|uniref:phosphoribosylglycinamide formyltransferase 1 n=1 Tax=Candidatus Sysuiplasma superficiale TaxID=2823368 RepID=A0A8J8CBG6_9ARCH|nr:phosphoribosylglycinamide formyltransferase [Candidatus Sysuiplasma superficiale]MCL4346811.1 phosphoribosylglycinamide formyltransferase [Candidatus Thermoplasmatota archaeon]
MAEARYSICVLASGNGSTMQAIVDACRTGYLNGSVVAVVSDNPGAYALKRAREAGIQAVVIDRKGLTQAEFDAKLLSFLRRIGPDIICLAGFLRILPSGIVNEFNRRILNIHPSLLPKYGGKGMYGIRVHRAVIENRERVSGCTVHIVTENVDDGPVILQRKVDVLPGDTPESLMERVHAEELKAYPEAIKTLMEGSGSVQQSIA